MRLSCVGWKVTMECSHGVTALYPPLATHWHQAPSSSTPETPSRIIQEAGATQKHTRVINPTLIAHFEHSSKLDFWGLGTRDSLVNSFDSLSISSWFLN